MKINNSASTRNLKKANTDLLLILKFWLEAYVLTYFQLKKLMELVI